MKRHLPLLLSAAACLLAPSAFAAPATLTPPDFTKGDKPGKEHDWTLGPTGARGWIFTANGHSHDSRQILITEVASGSPADGVLAVGDVILGVNAAKFADDARVQLAKAIAAAEGSDGALKLHRWRSGQTGDVVVKLAVLGSYSATAPYDCPKTKRILELGCASLAKRMSDEQTYVRRLDGISRALNGLALLASGNKDYLPLVKREAKWAADFTTDGYLSWYYGFMMTFVAEYIMTTGDTSVMPGLTRLALETARGQSGVGTWGHRFTQNGGNLSGYGAMNAPGLPLTIGMVLAREAGVKHADLDKAITKASSFLRWWVHKGAVPYGDHRPFFAHEDNGKCAAAAVLFDLLGDREAAEFFAKMAAAAYSERERGHTGNFFNMLWAMQGVARCGPVASGAYLKEQSWYYDLARGWDTRFIYQGSPVGAEEHGAYKNWDCSGSYLLDCALPLKSLRITGRKAFSVPPLDAAQAAEVIAAGRDFAYTRDENLYENRSTDQLLAGLASWSPFVRGRSAAALGKRDGDHLPALLKLLASTNRDARYGAVEALGELGPRADAAAAQLRACLSDSDPWLQSLAAEAVPNLSPAVRKACVSDLLAMTLRSNPADPRRMSQRAAAVALFAPFPGTRGPRSILADSLEGVDRKQLYPAIASMLQNEDSVVRSAVGRVYAKLSDEDVVRLLPVILPAIERLAPSNEMFADGVRTAGLDLLSRLHIREGMDLCIRVIEPERWGEKNRSHACLTALQRYGTHAKTMLPKLQAVREQLVAARRSKEHLAEFDKAVAAIQSSTETPTLVELRAFQARAVN